MAVITQHDLTGPKTRSGISSERNLFFNMPYVCSTLVRVIVRDLLYFSCAAVSGAMY